MNTSHLQSHPAPLLTGRKGFLYPELQSALFIYFPLSPKATLARAHCCPVSSLQDGFHKLERRQICQTLLHLYFSTDHPVATGDRHREADLQPSPCTGSGSKHETDDLFNFLESIATGMGSLVGSDKLCDMKKSFLPKTCYQVEGVFFRNLHPLFKAKSFAALTF